METINKLEPYKPTEEQLQIITKSFYNLPKLILQKVEEEVPDGYAKDGVKFMHDVGAVYSIYNVKRDKYKTLKMNLQPMHNYYLQHDTSAIVDGVKYDIPADKINVNESKIHFRVTNVLYRKVSEICFHDIIKLGAEWNSKFRTTLDDCVVDVDMYRKDILDKYNIKDMDSKVILYEVQRLK